jgi:hypothetical protein
MLRVSGRTGADAGGLARAADAGREIAGFRRGRKMAGFRRRAALLRKALNINTMPHYFFRWEIETDFSDARAFS